MKTSSKTMITRYKNITISKVNDDASKNPKAPSHSLIITDGDFKNKKKAGSLWTKESTYGKFLSGKMQDTAQREENIFEGYCIVSELELDKLLKWIPLTTLDAIKPDLKPEDIPF